MCQGPGPKAQGPITSWGCEQCLQRVGGVMRDPRWCDGRSNVNGVRHLHSFGSQPNLVKVVAAKCQRSRTGHRHHPPPCAIPPHRRALRILQLLRLLLLRAFQARAGQTRESQDGLRLALHCRWAGALLLPASASADSFGFFWEHCASAKAESLAEKENFLKRPPQACDSSEDGSLKGS